MTESTSREPERPRPTATRSIIAGSTAGAVEAAITYPAECTCRNSRRLFAALIIAVAKTRTQLNRRLPTGQKLAWPPLGAEWYAGCTTLIVGNALKAGVRFVAFEQYRALLGDADGRVSGPRTVLAGLLAGCTESALAVTPTESLKTTLIDDRRSATPRLRGPLHAIGVVWRERGPRGFLQGFAPTTARQAANSAVRFGSYAGLRSVAEAALPHGSRLGSAGTFAVGAAAGAVTVYATQPIDTVKTRMQSIEARALYRHSAACAADIVRREGVRALWSGAVPRLVRLCLSGGIVFAMYEKSMELMESYSGR
jgi:solute carrier family 25 citrate transporter 1